MKVAIGCDHAGWELKPVVMEYLSDTGIQVIDKGTHSATSVDYPDYAAQVAEAVTSGTADVGILICGTGLGMAIAANKFPGIRAVTVSDCFSAEMARAHNNANVLTMGSRVIGQGLALKIVQTFLTTPYQGRRHDRRLQKLKTIQIVAQSDRIGSDA
jgi:ribose 5-phosphate isomerase B